MINILETPAFKSYKSQKDEDKTTTKRRRVVTAKFIEDSRSLAELEFQVMEAEIDLEEVALNAAATSHLQVGVGATLEAANVQANAASALETAKSRFAQFQAAFDALYKVG